MTIFHGKSLFRFILAGSILIFGFTGLQAFAVSGDVNQDGLISIVDALLVARCSRETVWLLPDPAAADVNCDDEVTIIDALLIARYSAGLLQSRLGCDNPYPLSLPARSAEQQARIQKDFDTLNNNTVHTVINEFGFCGTTSIPLTMAPGDVLLTDEQEVYAAARAALIKNTAFTNVTADTPLVDNWITQLVNRYWLVKYEITTYKGLKIESSIITIKLQKNAFAIEGFYPPANIQIPDTVKISLEQAKTKVTGMVLTYYDIAGVERTYTVTESELTSTTTASKVIVTKQSAENLEYRYCWEIPIADRMWYIYVDVMSGEVVKTQQNFQT